MPKDVAKFEHQNDISIDVYILQKNKERFIVAPTHMTGDKQNRHANLLLIQNYYANEEEPDKPVENVRKRANIKLVTKWTGPYGVEALITKPNFKARSIFDANLVAIKLGQVRVLLNKPF